MEASSGTDVVNCLRVCKGLRSVIVNSMSSSSAFRRKMDIAATASAVHKRAHRETVKVEFDNDIAYYSGFSALDGRWYDLTEGNSSVIKLTPGGEMQKVPIVTSRRMCSVYPTLNNETVFVKGSKKSGNLTLLKLGQAGAETFRDLLHISSLQECMPFSVYNTPPPCLTYRLFLKHEPCGSTVSVIMFLLNENGQMRDNVILHQVEIPDGYDSEHPDTKSILQHKASNEEVSINFHFFYLPSQIFLPQASRSSSLKNVAVLVLVTFSNSTVFYKYGRGHNINTVYEGTHLVTLSHFRN